MRKKTHLVHSSRISPFVFELDIRSGEYNVSDMLRLRMMTGGELKESRKSRDSRELKETASAVEREKSGAPYWY